MTLIKLYRNSYNTLMGRNVIINSKHYCIRTFIPRATIPSSLGISLTRGHNLSYVGQGELII